MEVPVHHNPHQPLYSVPEEESQEQHLTLLRRVYALMPQGTLRQLCLGEYHAAQVYCKIIPAKGEDGIVYNH